ncbi:hypothetical protein U1Q18_033675 [Sarracenia purpurea var. burkii]
MERTGSRGARPMKERSGLDLGLRRESLRGGEEDEEGREKDEPTEKAIEGRLRGLSAGKADLRDDILQVVLAQALAQPTILGNQEISRSLELSSMNLQSLKHGGVWIWLRG